MRVLYLLLLVPLGALASCPAGIQLSNVPISTVLPYCVKFESSSLGGCEVACPGVCVELPNIDSKGPIQTTGSECELGGGGDNGGGDNGGGDNGGGDYREWTNFNHGGYVDIGRTISELNKNLGKTHSYTSSINGFTSQIYQKANELADNSFKMLQEDYKANSVLGEALPYIKESAGNTSGTNLYLSRMEPQLEIANIHLKKLADAANGGGESGGSSSGDTAAIKGMMQTAMGWWGGTPGNLNAINSQLTGISNSVAPMFPMLEHFNKQQANLQTQMAGDLSSIKDSLGNGQGSGGGVDIDYSKMPGAVGNPLQVAGAEYESTLCQGDVKCAFDLGQINKKYDESKEALKNAYKGIKTEVADIFKFQLSGSGSVPKCFEMYSLFGKTYSVCPSVGAYWETLAAIMMFVFYFVALMIVARR